MASRPIVPVQAIGRFDRLLDVGPPNKVDGQEIFGICLRKIPCSSYVSIEELAQLTEGCTGADISLICREAALLQWWCGSSLPEDVDALELSMRHFKTASVLAQPSDVQFYEDLSSSFERYATLRSSLVLLLRMIKECVAR